MSGGAVQGFWCAAGGVWGGGVGWWGGVVWGAELSCCKRGPCHAVRKACVQKGVNAQHHLPCLRVPGIARKGNGTLLTPLYAIVTPEPATPLRPLPVNCVGSGPVTGV